MSKLQFFSLLLIIYQMNSSILKEDNIILMATQDISIDLFTMTSTYEGILKIPKDRLKLYQVKEGSSAKYKVTSGSSVTVNTFGTITPRNTTWYWYGGMGYTSRIPDKVPTRIEVKFNLGTSTITVTNGNVSYKITVNVKDYATEYVENKLNEYIKTNVTNQKTQLDKLKAITAYPAQFPYNGSYYTYMNMVIFGGGDCWASSGLINYLCQKVGIKSHIRYAANDAGAGSGHRNVAALIDGKIYIAEAGYGYSKPNRPYAVTEKNVGYSYKTTTGGIIVYQYDGYDEDITVPSTIDGKTVIGLDKAMFRLGASNSGIDIKKIIIPDTIQTIGNSVFNSIPSLTTITIPKNVSSIGLYVFAGSDKLASINVNSANKYFSSVDGILYNKDKTEIVAFPPGKKVNYTGISTLKKIGDFAFYYAKQIGKITIPKSVSSIGEGAFAYSTIKEIYFTGDQPEFGQNFLYDLNVTIYYPKGNSKWNVKNLETYKSKQVRWVEWTSSPTILKEEIKENNNSSNIFIWVLPIISIIILVGIISLVIRKKNDKYKAIVDMQFSSEGLMV